MTTTLTFESGSAAVIVDAANGGRLASLKVNGHELLVTADTTPNPEDPKSWGSYPMVPWAGRIANGTFMFDGQQHQMPQNAGAHSLHGVGFTSPWTVVGSNTIKLELADPWPFGGTATQTFALGDNELRTTMSVEASTDMPIMVGWHPWFVRNIAGASAQLDFGQPPMYELGSTEIPTGELIEHPAGPWDNCFTQLDRDPTITWPGVLEVELASDLDHWVVYDQPSHALCVEPQSGAPDEFNRKPRILKAGQRFESWYTIAWTVT